MSLESITGLQVFSTCPSSSTTQDYLQRVIETAQWSEAAGCHGLLIYTDNSLVDPWLVAQIVIQHTRFQAPLVAVQPVYMHPYTVAKKIASLALLHGRRVCLNMVAGGFKNDLAALNDPTPHDSRYDRLIEYTTIILRLLEGGAPFSMQGRFYHVSNLTLQPQLPAGVMPEVLVSGSSAAGLAAARALGAIAVQYPEPPGTPQPARPVESGRRYGVRIGMVARADEDEAWDAALERFPDDRRGRMTRMVANKVSDSAWHGQLARISREMEPEPGRGTYWLHPFEQYQTNCPYLVGSYRQVAAEVARYIAAGNRTFILDIPATADEFQHAGEVFRLAARTAAEETVAGTAAAVAAPSLALAGAGRQE